MTLVRIRRPHIGVNDNFERVARSIYLGMFEGMDIVVMTVKHPLEFRNKIYPCNIEVLGTALSLSQLIGDEVDLEKFWFIIGKML